MVIPNCSYHQQLLSLIYVRGGSKRSSPPDIATPAGAYHISTPHTHRCLDAHIYGSHIPTSTHHTPRPVIFTASREAATFTHLVNQVNSHLHALNQPPLFTTGRSATGADGRSAGGLLGGSFRAAATPRIRRPAAVRCSSNRINRRSSGCQCPAPGRPRCTDWDERQTGVGGRPPWDWVGVFMLGNLNSFALDYVYQE